MAGEITLLNFNGITYNGSATSACGPTGVIQIRSDFCIGDNGDTTRQPDLSFHMNYVSGKWSGATMNNWICNESANDVTELNFRDSSFPRTKPTNITFTDGTNGEHLANGVSWFADAADTKYTTHVEQLGVGTGTTIYETSTHDTVFSNNTDIFMKSKINCCTSIYYNGAEKLKTMIGGVCTIGSSFATKFLVADCGILCYNGFGGDFCIINEDTTAASDIYINPLGGSVDLFHCNVAKMCTVSGGISVAGSVTCTSDLRLKEIVGDIDNPLDIINNLCAVKYKSKLTDDNCIHLGYIAQDIVNVLPEVVNSGDFNKDSDLGKIYTSLGIEDEVYGINYGGIIPVLGEAIKIQQACIDNLEERINVLENK